MYMFINVVVLLNISLFWVLEALLAKPDPYTGPRYATTWFSNLHEFYAVKTWPKDEQYMLNILPIRNPGLLQMWGGKHSMDK